MKETGSEDSMSKRVFRWMKILTCTVMTIFVTGLVPILAAEEAAKAPAENISVLWVLPFVGILLCIAIIPLINAHFWEKNLWWISLGVFCLPMSIIFSVFMGETLRHLTIEKALDYVSFIMLLASLFTISGGILIKGRLNGTPVVNAIFLLIGSVIASIVGTTGASMLLIRPLIRANADRQRKAHIVIFFIFLVSNIGGVLTPLGDPPLFLGYLQGVPFEWTFRLLPHWAFTTAVVLTVFIGMDLFMYQREGHSIAEMFKSLKSGSPAPGSPAVLMEARHEILSCLDQLDMNKLVSAGKIGIKRLASVREALASIDDKLMMALENPGGSGGISISGKVNLIFLAGVVVMVYLQGLLIKRVEWWPRFGPQEVGMAIMLGLSLLVTRPKSPLRLENGFTFQPIKEVALLFAGIFAAMIPALYILEHRGAELGIVQPWQFFWASGSLSSFLDNAPTYLTFLSIGKGLKLANDLGFTFTDGGNVTQEILAAISCGAVFMGANSYIGNGPNFMVRSIAEEQGVKMPSFFGYMVYSMAVLIPTFILVTLIFFR